MTEHCEMIANKFGRLLVLEMIGNRVAGRHPNWRCLCDCGKECVRSSVALKTGREPSCGCANYEFQRKKHDLTGQRFERLLVLTPKKISNKKRHIVWECVCDCGIKTEATGSELRSGHKKSCGCLRLDALFAIHTKHGHSSSQQLSPTYVSWAAMLTRCTNKNSQNFRHYGGRGILVCERWKNFENFLHDMGERPIGMSIDRIDVNGNYDPLNCKWADKYQQASNKRNNA